MINIILQRIGKPVLNYAINFLIRHKWQLIFRAAVVVYKEYEFYQARSYEKQLHYYYESYIQKSSEYYKQAAKQVLKQIEEYINQQNLSNKEKSELNDILQKHSSWVNKSST